MATTALVALNSLTSANLESLSDNAFAEGPIGHEISIGVILVYKNVKMWPFPLIGYRPKLTTSWDSSCARLRQVSAMLASSTGGGHPFGLVAPSLGENTLRGGEKVDEEKRELDNVKQFVGSDDA